MPSMKLHNYNDPMLIMFIFKVLSLEAIKAPFTLYRIHHISDYFLYQIGLPCTLYLMNPIGSVSLLRSEIIPL